MYSSGKAMVGLGGVFIANKTSGIRKKKLHFLFVVNK